MEEKWRGKDSTSGCVKLELQKGPTAQENFFFETNEQC